MIKNKLLRRQLKRCLGVSDLNGIAGLFVGEAADAGHRYLNLLAWVEESYSQYERDIALRTRSLDISSEELQEANEQLRNEISARKQALEHLRLSAAELLSSSGLVSPHPAEADTLETLSLLIGDLVRQRLRLEKNLRSSERRFRDLTEMSSDWFWEQDKEYRFTEMSSGASRSLSSTENAIGKTVSQLPIIGMTEREWLDYKLVLERHEAFQDFIFQTEAAPGHMRWSSVSGKPLFTDDGEFYGYRGTGKDITARKLAEDELRLAASVFETSAEAVLVTDAETQILAVNPAFEAITGFSREEALGRTPRILSSGLHDPAFYHRIWEAIARDGHWRGEIYDRRKTGESYVTATSISAVRDDHGAICRYVSVFSDISERKQAEERISYLAQHDFLTGLPNRVLMEDRLNQAIQMAERTHGTLALIFVDLDHFKTINDSLGHHIGDLVLRVTAERLRDCVRTTDTVCRLGGDEFLVILGNVSEAKDAARLADKILASLAESCVVDGHELYVTPSIGIGLYPQDGTDLVSLMKNADAAMYHAKKNGRNGYQFFTTELNDTVSERLAVENSLRHALERQEFQLYYQPQVDTAGSIIGVEALVRWQHPQWGMVPPSRFIPVAEENGLIIPLGEWILRTACRQCQLWQQQGWSIPVAVNISAVQFHHKGFMNCVSKALRDFQLRPGSLELELTEGVVMRHSEETSALLRRLKQVGVFLSIDDFGTGYSSLSYLKRFPIDRLKIDQSFVRDVTADLADAEIIKAIVALAHALGLSVIAEGVETAEQLAKLAALGVEEYQGYHFHRPLPADAFQALLGKVVGAPV